MFCIWDEEGGAVHGEPSEPWPQLLLNILENTSKNFENFMKGYYLYVGISLFAVGDLGGME